MAAGLGKSRGGQEAPSVTEKQCRSACRLYVGALHYDVRESDIKTIFSAFGPITNIDMSFDQMTGKSRGYCFVEYAGGHKREPKHRA